MKKLIANLLLTVPAVGLLIAPSVALAGGPLTPTNLRVTNLTCNNWQSYNQARVSLTWDTPSSVSYYILNFRQYFNSYGGYSQWLDRIPDSTYTGSFSMENDLYVSIVAVYTDSAGSFISSPKSPEILVNTTSCKYSYPTPVPSPTLIPFPTPTPTPSDYFPTSLALRVLAQFPEQTPKGLARTVLLEWTGASGSNVRYYIYARPDQDAPLGSAGWTTSGTAYTGNTGEMTLMSEYNYYVKVQACKITDPNYCISSPSVFVPKVSYPTTTSYPRPTYYPKPRPTVFPTPVATSSASPSTDPRINELNKKVDRLQQELNQTQKRQSQLEQTVNNLMNWIKSIFSHFPFSK